MSVEIAKEIPDESAIAKNKEKKNDKGKEKLSTTPKKKDEDREHHAEKKDEDESEVLERLGLGKMAKMAAKDVKNKELLGEYLAAMRSSKSAPVWSNITGTKESDYGSLQQSADSVVKDSDDSGSESDDYEELPGSSTTPKTMDTDAESEEEEEVKKDNSALSDMDFLRSKVSKSLSDSENPSDGEDNSGDGEESDELDESEDEAEAPKSAKSSKKDAAKDKGAEQEKKTGTDTRKPGKTSTAKDGSEADEKSEPADPLVALAEHGRLFVRNLPYGATESEFRAHFAKYGPIADALLPVDSAGCIKGYGFVTYMIPEDAVLALSKTDGKVFQGRLLHVMPAKPQEELTVDGTPGDEANAAKDAPSNTSSFKKEKEQQRKDEAVSGKEEGSVWNTLFIRSDTALAAAAASLGVEKGDIMDRDAKNLAVRMALAETRVVAATKEFLAENGVSLPTLEQSLELAAVASTGHGKRKKESAGNSTSAGGVQGAGGMIKRSETVIMVKNLPFDAEIGALREMFGRFGVLSRFVVPASRAIALVEFVEPKSAKKAFASLAYTRFQRVPLYLEWAPEAIFIEPPPKPANAKESEDTVAPSVGDKKPTGKASEKEKEKASRDDKNDPGDVSAASEGKEKEDKEEDEEENTEERTTDGRTLFVKNLNFGTNEEGMRAHFATIGKVRSVTIPKRRNPAYRLSTDSSAKSANEWLSMGYGFVVFDTKQEANKALRQLQGKELDGNALQLKVSIAKQSNLNSAKKEVKKITDEYKTCTKIMVRNLAFEATKSDLQELFSTYGTIKTVRVPRKFDGSNRGFAFIEFLTHAEAAAAMSSLASTHLYGRHLVLEWSVDEPKDTANSNVETAQSTQATRKRKKAPESEKEQATPPPPPQAAPVEDKSKSAISAALARLTGSAVVQENLKNESSMVVEAPSADTSAVLVPRNAPVPKKMRKITSTGLSAISSANRMTFD